ncbi:UNVERIFIED_CONTAM: Phospholipase A-2-activating protein [Sesamum calycinum]|uniref:Phospholipase A-2-activating protein n=1 Tax=Sesamum calycinum TaxID=2727403 RepID=A0AAW2PP17_9LAMI
MDIDFKEYQLRCQLRGHEDDARGICICGNAGIATSSRDRTVRFWTLDESQKHDYTMSKMLLGHTSFVGPLSWIPPNEEFPQGGIVSGGMDTLILVWNLATGEKVQMLKGHKLQVTGIALDGSDIISVSVDCTLRRWRGGQQLEAWEAHNAAIQAIIKLPSGELVTGSSDMTLKLWKGKSCIHTFLGHTDTVRGLAVMPNLGIVSASHDGSIRLWAISGELLMEMVGHTSIVYSVDAHASGLIVSGSEDCSAKIWKDGVCVQSIEHPGCVWDAKFLENGDIVTACSDGVVRVWTLDHDKIADAVELDLFASLLSQYKISRKRVGGLKLEDLPGLDALKTPGTSDGQTKVVREGDNGVAYAWNMREQKWDKYLTSTLEMVSLYGNCRITDQKGMLVFDSAQFDGILRKISEFNNTLLSDAEKKCSSLNEGDMSRLSAIVKILKDTSHYHSSRFSDVDIALMMKLLKTWPVPLLFPVIDVMRMIVTHPDGVAKLLQYVKNEDDIVSELIKKVTASSPLPANLFTSIRVVTNLFKNSFFHEWLLAHRGEILDAFSSCCSSSNKNVQISYATLLLNYSVLLIEKKDEEGQSQVLSAALEMAEEDTIDSDSRFRALVAIGSLMLEGLVRRVALDFDVVNIAKAAKASKDAKIAEVAADIELVAKQN